MNLHRRSVLIIASILFFAIGINSAVLTYISYDRYKQAVLSKATSVSNAMVKEIEKVIALGLSIENIEGINEKLKGMTEDATIGYSMLLDMKGKILFHSDERDVGKIYKDPGTLEALASKKTLVQEWGDFYDIASPLINAEGKHVGMLRIGVASAVIKKELYNLLVWSGSLFVIGFFLFVAIIYFSVSRFITRPITKLGNAVAEIAKGDLDVKVEVTSKDEIGQLSESFNKMAMELKESRDNLLEYSSELGTKVEKRTAELKQLGHQQELILFSAGEGIFGLDVHGNHTIVNTAAAQMLGYTVDELIGRYSHTTWHHSKADGSPYHEDECPIYATLKYSKSHHMVEEVFWRKDGTSFPVEYTSVPITEDEKIIGAVVTFSDITERKEAEEEKFRLEEQLQHAKKMESIGTLAGGIANDFNNILTAIIGFGSLLKTEMTEYNPLTIYVTRILSSAQRAATLTRSLLAFSRTQIINPMPVDLNEIVKAMEYSLDKLIGDNIELSTVLTDEDLTISADTYQMEKVLLNLAENAMDAIKDGGSLIIRTERFELDNNFIQAHGYGKSGPYAFLSIEDSGQGIDEETKERIFEPFFTTKEVGKGTGLGLSIVYGIIKQHGGYINVYSELGKGTTFKIYLPLSKPTDEAVKEAASAMINGGTETVLVAENDAEVREMIKEVLKGSGYRVVEAENGEKAIRVFHENREGIQLLILDVLMPKKNGKEVFDEIRKVRPDMKAIFTSGYDINVIYKKGFLEEESDFVSKPILPDKLLRKVREVLDS